MIVNESKPDTPCALSHGKQSISQDKSPFPRNFFKQKYFKRGCVNQRWIYATKATELRSDITKI